MAMTISGELIHHVRTIFGLAVTDVLSGNKGVRHENNGFTDHGLPAYVVSCAALEAFVNESLLDDFARRVWKDSPLWKIQRRKLERLDLRTKAIVVPQLLFGQTFDTGGQPYQDLILLLKVRNDVVHFQMKVQPPKYLDVLTQRGIALSTGDSGADYPWPARLACTEGIRWAHNVACKVAHELANLSGEPSEPLASLVSNFREIDEAEMRGCFEEPT